MIEEVPGYPIPIITVKHCFIPVTEEPSKPHGHAVCPEATTPTFKVSFLTLAHISLPVCEKLDYMGGVLKKVSK